MVVNYPGKRLFSRASLTAQEHWRLQTDSEPNLLDQAPHRRFSAIEQREIEASHDALSQVDKLFRKRRRGGQFIGFDRQNSADDSYRQLSRTQGQKFDIPKTSAVCIASWQAPPRPSHVSLHHFPRRAKHMSKHLRQSLARSGRLLALTGQQANLGCRQTGQRFPRTIDKAKSSLPIEQENCVVGSLKDGLPAEKVG
jgi:outer membrane PBP1 activator LpoA protein